MTTEQRFDQVLDGAQDTTLFDVVPKDLCVCPKHTPWPEEPIQPNWQVRFGNREWNVWRAMTALGIGVIDTPDADLDPGTRGYTNAQGIWLRPNAVTPMRVAAHELAHNVLGHVAFSTQLRSEALAGSEGMAMLAVLTLELTKPVKEVEAEMTALLVMDALGYPDGKIQTLAAAQAQFKQQQPVGFPDRQRVKKAALKILKAGGWKAQRLAA